MDVQEALARVNDSRELKSWFALHDGGFLAHAFVLLDEANKDSVQVGYYFPAGDSMTTFVVTKKDLDKSNKAMPEFSIMMSADQQIIKTEAGVHELKVELVKISQSEALSTAEKQRAEMLGAESILKTFFILQDLGDGPIFNISFFSQAFKTLNCKVSAIDGKLLYESVQKLADLTGRR